LATGVGPRCVVVSLRRRRLRHRRIRQLSRVHARGRAEQLLAARHTGERRSHRTCRGYGADVSDGILRGAPLSDRAHFQSQPHRCTGNYRIDNIIIFIVIIVIIVIVIIVIIVIVIIVIIIIVIIVIIIIIIIVIIIIVIIVIIIIIIDVDVVGGVWRGSWFGSWLVRRTDERCNDAGQTRRRR
jgi:hypothetical protein